MDYTYKTGVYDYRTILGDHKFKDEEDKLKIRHKQLLAEREALLYGIPEPDKLNKTSTLDRRQAYTASQRNKRLMDDMRKTKAKIIRNTNFHETKARRLSNISQNYWSMVRNLQPLWEQSCGMRKSR